MNEIKLKGRIASLHTEGNPDLAEILLTPQEFIKQFNWYELINLKLEISDILADKIMKEKILPKQPEPKQERIKESDERRIIDEQDITIRTYLERRIDNIKQDLIEHIYNYHTTKQPSSLYPHEIAEKVNELIDVLNNAIGKLREVGR